MLEKIVARWQRALLRLMAAAAILAGIALLAVASSGWFVHPFDEIVRDIGLAFLVSVIIGGSYEWVIRTRLLEDTLKVALGYILPDELKAEVRALYEIPFLCTRHLQSMRLEPTSNPEAVILHMKVERTLKNVTSRKQPLPVSTSVHEWFFEGLSSRIINIEAVQGKQRWNAFNLQKSPGSERCNRLEGRLAEAIDVAPGESVTVLYEVEEVKRGTDVHQWVFGYPTIEPEVTFERAVGAGVEGILGVNIQFHGRDADKVEKIGNKLRCLGVLLPNQPIELRWWQKRRFETWMSEGEVKVAEARLR